ncbi:MAG TPA: hypothetical protein VKA43_17070 [Gammaproteobacteria bacterium]|nr:hypothetical protein [Gammaproteobacteria bacterium]
MALGVGLSRAASPPPETMTGTESKAMNEKSARSPHHARTPTRRAIVKAVVKPANDNRLYDLAGGPHTRTSASRITVDDREKSALRCTAAHAAIRTATLDMHLLLLYIALAGALFSAMARGFGWI